MTRSLTFAVLAAAFATSSRAEDPSPVPLGDEYFAMQAYSSGVAEIAKSRIALQRATDSKIKEYAEQLIKDHTECNNKIAELARRKRIGLPTTIDQVHAAAIAHLSRLTGSDFDKAYVMAQVCAHEEALHLFGAESRKGKDSDFKDLAHKSLSTLWSHAKSAFELAEQDWMISSGPGDSANT